MDCRALGKQPSAGDLVPERGDGEQRRVVQRGQGDHRRERYDDQRDRHAHKIDAVTGNAEPPSMPLAANGPIDAW